MRTVLCGMLLSVSMISMVPAARAAGYTGFYVAAKGGANRSSAFDHTVTSGYAAAEMGYNFAFLPDMIVGVDAWGDNHHQSATGRDAGVDARLGNISDKTLFYLKIGVAGTAPGNRVHYGLGVERMIDAHWGGLVEWTGDTTTRNGTTYKNNNLMLGVTLHL